MPQIDADGLLGTLDADHVIMLFTVQNLGDMVAQRASRLSELRLRVGVDVVGVERIARLIDESGAVADSVFTHAELDYCRQKRQHEHMAARFAAKEAVLKAIGTGLRRRMSWTDVEVQGGAGRPGVRLHGEVAPRAHRKGIADIDLSISHSAGCPRSPRATRPVSGTSGVAVPPDRPGPVLRAGPIRTRPEGDVPQRGVLGGAARGVEMPAPLVLEALCQAGTWLVMITTERRKRAALLSIGSVDFWARCGQVT